MIDRKKTMEQLEEVSHAVEPEKPSSKSWLYIFGAVILIFGLTFIFQQMSGISNGEVRPADIESLQAEIAELRGTVSDLEARIDALENECVSGSCLAALFMLSADSREFFQIGMEIARIKCYNE